MRPISFPTILETSELEHSMGRKQKLVEPMNSLLYVSVTTVISKKPFV